MSSTTYRRDEMNFAVGPYRGKPDILKNFAVDCYGETVLLQMRCKRRIAFTEFPQQLFDVAGIDFDFRNTARKLLQITAENQSCQSWPSADYAACSVSIAASTRGGDIGRSVKRTPLACETALAIAAIGGTIGVSPTPRTP